LKFDREKDAIEYTQDPDQYTFHPEILGDKRPGSKMPTFAEMKGMKNQQQSSDIINIDSLENSAAEDEPASVRIDIALGDKRHRITLFADSDPAQLSADFAKETGLDAKLQSKLKDQLEENIKKNF